MATNFLEATGGSTAGYFSAVTTLASSEITGLAVGATTTSASVFTSSGSFGQAIWGEIALRILSSATNTPTAGAFIAGWFLRSPDGGTTFEIIGSSNGAMGRPPDFVIPASTVAYASSAILYASGIVKMPWSPVKIGIQNNLGITYPASGSGYSTLSLAPVAVQY